MIRLNNNPIPEEVLQAIEELSINTVNIEIVEPKKHAVLKFNATKNNYRCELEYKKEKDGEIKYSFEAERYYPNGGLFSNIVNSGNDISDLLFCIRSIDCFMLSVETEDIIDSLDIDEQEIAYSEDGANYLFTLSDHTIVKIVPLKDHDRWSICWLNPHLGVSEFADRMGCKKDITETEVREILKSFMEAISNED